MSRCNRPNCAKQPAEHPTASLFGSIFGPDHIQNLLEIVEPGLQAGNVFRRFSFKNTPLEDLAKRISDLAIENAYLKKVTDLFSPVRVAIEPENAVIHFGPTGAYTLSIPVRTKNDRDTLSRQLRAAADMLDARPTADADPQQQVFPFAQ